MARVKRTGAYNHWLPIEERKKKIWAALNRHGIFTEEQFEEAYRNLKPIDISCMAGKINWPEDYGK